MASVLDESPGLLLDARHVRVGGVNQSGDLCGPKAVLCYRPAQVQTRCSHIGLHRPVGVGGAVDVIASLVVGQLWNAGALVGDLDCGLYVLNFRLCQKTDHICSLEELKVALV